jgi:hypothetical protein
MVCRNSFPLVRRIHGNGLRSRERRFESYRGTGQRYKFEHSDNLALNRGSSPPTCGNAQAFRILCPIRARKQAPATNGPAQAHSVITAARPLPSPQVVALPGIRSYAARRRRRPGTAVQPARSPRCHSVNVTLRHKLSTFFAHPEPPLGAGPGCLVFLCQCGAELGHSARRQPIVTGSRGWSMALRDWCRTGSVEAYRLDGEDPAALPGGREWGSVGPGPPAWPGRSLTP